MSQSPTDPVKELIEAAEKATPGPWHTKVNRIDAHTVEGEGACQWVGTMFLDSPWVDNGEFVCAAPSPATPEIAGAETAAIKVWYDPEKGIQTENISREQFYIASPTAAPNLAQPIPDAKVWLVWSNEHTAWWKPGCLGYTADAEKAGRYTLADARKHANSGQMGGTCARCEHLPNEVVTPAPEFVASPAPADGFVKMDNPDYAGYLRKDWVMVPKEPTAEMQEAGYIAAVSAGQMRNDTPAFIWEKMLAAAPKVAE